MDVDVDLGDDHEFPKNFEKRELQVRTRVTSGTSGGFEKADGGPVQGGALPLQELSQRVQVSALKGHRILARGPWTPGGEPLTINPIR
jgi:hypothetical protein